MRWKTLGGRVASLPWPELVVHPFSIFDNFRTPSYSHKSWLHGREGFCFMAAGASIHPSLESCSLRASLDLKADELMS